MEGPHLVLNLEEVTRTFWKNYTKMKIMETPLILSCVGVSHQSLAAGFQV